MNKQRFFVLLAVMALISLGILSGAASAKSKELEAKAKLHGRHEVPAVSTKAKGEAEFKLAEDGLSLEYKLKVEDIENAVAAHIHLGPKGSNGPVVAWLYGPVPAGGGSIKGKIAEGTITAINLVGPLTGQSLSALVAEIEAGNAYVNVHTNDGVGAPNTGAGDMASGEIRGQLHSH